MIPAITSTPATTKIKGFFLRKECGMSLLVRGMQSIAQGCRAHSVMPNYPSRRTLSIESSFADSIHLLGNGTAEKGCG